MTSAWMEGQRKKNTGMMGRIRKNVGGVCVRSKRSDKLSSGLGNNYTDLVRIKAAGVDPDTKSHFKDHIIGLAFF